MALGFGAVAHAQALPCGGLSADDCAVLNTAFANTSNLTSGAMNFVFGLNVDSTDPSQKVDFSLNAALRFTGAQGLGMFGTLSNPAGAMTNPTDMLSGMTNGLQSANAELTLNLNLPQQAAMMTGGNSAINLEMKFVDGISYINFDGLIAGLGPQMAQMFQLPSGWVQLDTTGSEEMAGAFLGGFDPSSMTQDSAGAATQIDPAQMQEAVNQYYTITRDGNNFVLSVDLAGMLSDPQFQQAMESSGSSNPLTAQQIAALSEFPMSVVFTVTDDGYLSGASFDLTLTQSWLQAMQTEPSSEPLPNAVKLQFSLTLSEFNQVGDIAAPAGAPVVNLAELISQGFGAMMGGMSG
jgi:hypothetical protein